MPFENDYSYTTFRIQRNNQLNEPMFFGNLVNISRFDQQKYNIFERLIDKQLSFFWRPEEIDLSRDRIDFQSLSAAEKHIFLSNLKYQILLDSIQARSPNVAFLPIVSLPELETWIETWSFSETIHSRSYTYMVRSLVNNPGSVFDDIIVNKNIQTRAIDVSCYYDDLIFKTQLFHSMKTKGHCSSRVLYSALFDVKKALHLALHSVNALEGIRFYVSFACTFAFSEQKKIEGCGKLMKLIARDEALHLVSTQHMLNLIYQGHDGDSVLTDIFRECKKEAYQIFIHAVEQEKAWAKFLFKNGSILGLNTHILCQYIDFIAKERMAAIGFEYKNNNVPKNNPIPWISAYLNSDYVQVAPQETEISSYLVHQIKSSIDKNAFVDFVL